MDEEYIRRLQQIANTEDLPEKVRKVAEHCLSPGYQHDNRIPDTNLMIFLGDPNQGAELIPVR